MKTKPITKFLHVRIPIYMYQTIQELAPLISTTINGTIITMLDHGINYEMKKRRKEMKKTATGEVVTVDQDQNNNSEESRIRQALKKMGYTDEQLEKMDNETQRNLLYKILKTEIK